MKKFIALGAALIVLLFGFVASAEYAEVDNGGVMVAREDLPLAPFPYD